MTFLTLQDFDGVFVDALVADRDGALLFLSAWARDTVASELLAKMSLPQSENGLKNGSLIFQAPDLTPTRVTLPSDELLVKTTGRMPKESIYGGQLVHLWIYQKLLRWPDQANKRGAFLCLKDEPPEARDDKLWRILNIVCPVPLLDQWRDPAIQAFLDAGAIDEIPGFRVTAFDLRLTEPEEMIRDLLRDGIFQHPDRGVRSSQIAAE